jgi:hypothetical protein
MPLLKKSVQDQTVQLHRFVSKLYGKSFGCTTLSCRADLEMKHMAVVSELKLALQNKNEELKKAIHLVGKKLRFAFSSYRSWSGFLLIQ